MDTLTTVGSLPDDHVNGAAPTGRPAGRPRLNPVRHLRPMALGSVVACLAALPMIIVLNRAGQNHGTPRVVRPETPGSTVVAPHIVSAPQPSSGSPSRGTGAGTSPSASLSPARPAALAPTTYEAESKANSLGGGARAGTLPGASGGSAVYAIGGSNFGTLQFNGIAAPAIRTYTLIIYYQNPDQSSRSGTLSVNGGAPIPLTFGPTVTCCATRVAPITLYAGATNTIQFGGQSGKAPDIDRVVVTDTAE